MFDKDRTEEKLTQAQMELGEYIKYHPELTLSEIAKSKNLTRSYLVDIKAKYDEMLNKVLDSLTPEEREIARVIQLRKGEDLNTLSEDIGVDIQKLTAIVTKTKGMRIPEPVDEAITEDLSEDVVQDEIQQSHIDNAKNHLSWLAAHVESAIIGRRAIEVTDSDLDTIRFAVLALGFVDVERLNTAVLENTEETTEE